MVETEKRLMRLSAADIMSRNVVVLPREMSLPGAARMLAQAGVTGAPVVDAGGRCIGVLSATEVFLGSAIVDGSDVQVSGHRR